MDIISSINELKIRLAACRADGKKIGFVPTMGALHEGHISLVRRCDDENNICVASIFVNPTQFNDMNDLAAYPRTPEKDYALLESSGCDYVFAPSELEMYPSPDLRVFDLGAVSSVMEGKYRQGHFNGVAQVVSKLFEAVEPDNAYFGEKDFQQIAVIRVMTGQLNMPVKIISCPIVREADGLAMSSRNMRLTQEQRQTAPIIARTLSDSISLMAEKTVQEVIDYVTATINRVGLKVEYFDIVDGYTLMPVHHWDDACYVVGCIAAYCGEVRLIDNITYRK